MHAALQQPEHDPVTTLVLYDSLVGQHSFYVQTEDCVLRWFDLIIALNMTGAA